MPYRPPASMNRMATSPGRNCKALSEDGGWAMAPEQAASTTAPAMSDGMGPSSAASRASAAL
eukprot:4330024-Lingulodinium_polyedra.AAC.1